MVSSMKNYTKPSFKCESDSREIKRLAKRIVGKKKGRAAVKSIFLFVRDNIDYDIADVVGARGVLKRKPRKAVCVDKANLMVALCRASGIPARYISADVVLKTKKGQLPVKHMYADVFYGKRWKRLDPSFGRSSVHFIKPSKFDKVDNFKLKTKETRFASLPWFIPSITWFMYRLLPSMLKIKTLVRGGA